MNEVLWIGSESEASEWSNEMNKTILEGLYHTPFFESWGAMTIGLGSQDIKPVDFNKGLNLLCANKPKVSIRFYEEKIGEGENTFNIGRDKNFNGFMIQLKKDTLNKFSTELFREYVIRLAIQTPNFKRLIGSQGSISAEIQRKYNIEQEKSIFSYMSWLNVVSPLSYNGYYEKEDLLKAPFYRVEEIAPDIIMIQAYKDPFDLENEESLNYLRNGVEYLNKHIVYLKEK